MNTKSEYRIGKPVRQKLWQIKRAPGWSIAARCETLEQAAEWLRERGVDLSTIHVVSTLPGFLPGEWPTLSDALNYKISQL